MTVIQCNAALSLRKKDGRLSRCFTKPKCRSFHSIRKTNKIFTYCTKEGKCWSNFKLLDIIRIPSTISKHRKRSWIAFKKQQYTFEWIGYLTLLLNEFLHWTVKHSINLNTISYTSCRKGMNWSERVDASSERPKIYTSISPRLPNEETSLL